MRVMSIVLVVSAVVSLPLHAAEPRETLAVGDAAPPISVSKWVQGDGVSVFETGKVYVVEFWATWCESSLLRMPYLSSINTQLRDKGVIVVGVNVGGHDASVEPLLREMGDQVNYSIAIEGAHGRTSEAWQPHIPRAVVVDRHGRIAWFGPSMKELQKVLRMPDVLDAKKERLLAATLLEMEDSVHKAFLNPDNDERILGVLAVHDKFMKRVPAVAAEIAMYKFSWMFVTGHQYDDEAYTLGSSLLDGTLHESAEQLHEMACVILRKRSDSARFLDLALKMVLRADEVFKHQDAPVLSTVARIYAQKGDWDRAIAVQEMAISNAENEVIMRRLESPMPRLIDDDVIKKKYSAPLENYRRRVIGEAEVN